MSSTTGQAWAQLTQDAQWALRSLGRRPFFTVAVALMLAVGIGLNAAIFTVVDAALFKGFRHVQRNDQLVRVGTTTGAIYYPDFEEWRTQGRALADLALVRGVFHTLRAGADSPQTVFAMEVTANTFGLLGVSPVVGRDFRPEDAQPGAEPVVVLRHDVWTRLFRGAPDVVGQRIPLDGVPTTVIGVMPAGFAFPAEQELWTPLIPNAAAIARATPYARYAYGRLADGASVDTARAELQTIGDRLAREFPATNRLVSPTVSGFDDWFVGRQSKTLYLSVWGAVGCVLLIVCGNVANLFGLQVIGRSNELLVRQALGASRARLVRQFALEAGLLAGAGGAAAWLAAVVGLGVFRAAVRFPPMLSVDVDVAMFGYLWAVCAIAGGVTGGAAAVHLVRVVGAASQAGATRMVAESRRGARLIDAFVALQVALAIVLLVSAGVLARALIGITTASAGIDATNVVTASLYLPPERYPSVDARLGFFRTLEARLSAHPDVNTIGFAAIPPTERTPRDPMDVSDAIGASPETPVPTASLAVSPGYFRAVGATIVEGRDVQWADTASAAVVLVNQRLAERHWPGVSPIGRRLRFMPSSGPPGEWLTVVGMTSNIVQNDPTRQAIEAIAYVPYGQRPQPNMFAFVRSRTAIGASATAIREAVYELDATLPVPSLAPLETRLSQAHTLERQVAAMLGVFSTLALLLAAVGVYAVIAQAVASHAREIGIRVAVGAGARDVVAAVAGGRLKTVAVGVGAGLVLSAGTTQVLTTQFASAFSWDPLVVALATTMLAVAVTCGCLVPVRRALRVDPAIVLREE